ncbi:MAG TPA: DnaJ domain-containing protein, partial [Candidatus Acidoferrales bacterium]|nr:DnaJ domain-containing protein [Candidatus Acidoferrales bacterium]
MANSDYYVVLGVARGAAAREIRRAYRALARQYHPDLHPNDPAAAGKFRELQEAYDVLGDARKRKAYDYYGAGFGQRVPVGTGDPGRQGAPPRSVPVDFGRYASRGPGPVGPFPTSWGSGRSPARSFNNLLGRLVFVAVFVVGAVAYFLWPNPGVREFRRTLEALRNVQSVKIQSSDSGVIEYLDEVSCPASGRMTRHLRSTVNGQPFAMTLVTLTIGANQYIYTDKSNSWARDWFGGSRYSGFCTRLAHGEDAGLFSFQQWLDGMEFIERENLRKTPDGNCREWKIQEPSGLGRMPTTYFVCIDVKT